MNIELVKEELAKRINRNVIVSVYGLRNRVNKFEGQMYKIYPNIFTVMTQDGEKSFTYRDVITGEVKIKYV